jgi:hypothetical protein
VGQTCEKKSTTRCTTTLELESRVCFAWTSACCGFRFAAMGSIGDSAPHSGIHDGSPREVDLGHPCSHAKIHPIGLTRCQGLLWSLPDRQDPLSLEKDAYGEDLWATCRASGSLPMGLKARGDPRTTRPDHTSRCEASTGSDACLMWECDITVTAVVNQSNVISICSNYCLILTP